MSNSENPAYSPINIAWYPRPKPKASSHIVYSDGKRKVVVDKNPEAQLHRKAMKAFEAQQNKINDEWLGE